MKKPSLDGRPRRWWLWIDITMLLHAVSVVALALWLWKLTGIVLRLGDIVAGQSGEIGEILRLLGVILESLKNIVNFGGGV